MPSLLTSQLSHHIVLLKLSKWIHYFGLRNLLLLFSISIRTFFCKIHWFGFYAVSATVDIFYDSESPNIDRVASDAATVSMLRRSFFLRRPLHGLSFLAGEQQHADFAAQMHLRKRYIHSTGTCYSAAKDYYKMLGVSRNASRDEIKKAFHATTALNVLVCHLWCKKHMQAAERVGERLWS